MSENAVSLRGIFDGWDGYNTALIRAIEPRTPDELAWRPAPDKRSVGETAAHIALGRIDWFHRMGAPGSEELFRELAPPDGWNWGALEPGLAGDPAALVHWLERSWRMIENNLRNWTVADLSGSYRQPFGGKVYAVPRQWVIFRMLIHDVQHGGQLTVMLGLQGVDLPDLGYLGGHLTEPPLAE